MLEGELITLEDIKDGETVLVDPAEMKRRNLPTKESLGHAKTKEAKAHPKNTTSQKEEGRAELVSLLESHLFPLKHN